MGRERTTFSCDEVGCKEQYDEEFIGDYMAPTAWGVVTFHIVGSVSAVRKYLCPEHAEKLKRYFAMGDPS
jgi:hypothetical protein